jgi:hypothetical protein
MIEIFNDRLYNRVVSISHIWNILLTRIRLGLKDSSLFFSQLYNLNVVPDDQRFWIL